MPHMLLGSGVFRSIIPIDLILLKKLVSDGALKSGNNKMYARIMRICHIFFC